MSTFNDSSSDSSSAYFSRDDSLPNGDNRQDDEYEHQSVGSLEEAIHLMDGTVQPSAPPGSERTVGSLYDNSFLVASPVGASVHTEDATTPQEEHHLHYQQQEFQQQEEDQRQREQFVHTSTDHRVEHEERQSGGPPCVWLIWGCLCLLGFPVCGYAVWIIVRHHTFRSKLPLAAGVECRRDSHCASGVCAYGTSRFQVNVVVPNDDEEEAQICCPEGSIWTTGFGDDGSFRRVCTNMPIGTPCGTMDSMCASGYCIGGTCVARALRSQQRCDRNRDCVHNACAHSQAYVGAPTACCATNATRLATVPLGLEVTATDAHLTVQVCGALDVGAFCHDQDVLCASGLCIDQRCAAAPLPDWEACEIGSNHHCQSGACGLSTLSNETMCCPGGATTAIAVSGDSGEAETELFAERTLCANMPLRTPCFDTDTLCASGHCVRGSCANSLLGPEQVCEDSTDCFSGTCALADASINAVTVCCPEGALDGVCMGRSMGAICGENIAICGGGLVCLEGVCSSPLIDNEFCSSSMSCSSQACAKGEGTFEARNVCCASGKVTPGQVGFSDSTLPVTLCAEQPMGTYCGNNDVMCASGLVCVNGRCGEPLGPLEQCIKANDCSDGACALATTDASSSTVCCLFGTTANGFIDDGSGGAILASICTNQPLGVSCGEFTDLCAPGLRCIDEVCAEPLGAGAPCTTPLDCSSGKCASPSANQTTVFTVCCGSTFTTFEDLYDASGTAVIGVSEVCGTVP